MEFNAGSLFRNVTIKAFLPTDGLGGSVIEPPYKTCYFLPGYSLDAIGILTYMNLRKQCELKGMAIVLVDGCNSFYIDHPERNENFSKFIGEDLINETRKILPLSEKREDTFIAGISMGGYGALYNGLKYSDKFSKVAALSPAVDPHNLLCDFPEIGFRPEVFESYFKDKETYLSSDKNLYMAYPEAHGKRDVPEVFIACGNGDGLVWDSVKRFHDTLDQHKIAHTFVETTGNHEFDVWERMADSAFSFLASIEPETKDRLVLGF